jgi:mannose-1-phosphate guanylyltransferase/mannose-6-phosphate isomerase
MQRAVREAATGSIVILGIAPSHPETGYGYIQAEIAQNQESALVVRRFVEKPDAATAQTYLDEGGYYWNAGMFVLKASVWMAALSRFRPDIAQSTHQPGKSAASIAAPQPASSAQANPNSPPSR